MCVCVLVFFGNLFQVVVACVLVRRKQRHGSCVQWLTCPGCVCGSACVCLRARECASTFAVTVRGNDDGGTCACQPDVMRGQDSGIGRGRNEGEQGRVRGGGGGEGGREQL